jgi:RHS repeat-associated protein
VCVAGPGDRVHTFERDAVGRVVGVVAPSGRTSFERDERGRVVSRAVASGETTRWTHHPSGRVASCALPGGGTSRFRWDPAGRLASAVDANGDETRYRWDAAGFLTGVVDPLGGVETYANDLMGRMVASTDQLGHRTDVFVDRAGRVAGHRDPTGAEVRLTRDGGRVTGWTASPSGERGTFGRADPLALPDLPRVTYADPQWDAADQLIAWRDAHGRRCTRAYDAAGRMTRQTSPDGDERLSYDSAGRLLEVVRKGPSPAVTTYRYDAAGRRTREMRCELGRVGSVRYRWDGLGRLREVHHWDGRQRRVTRIDVDPLGQLVGIDGDLGDLVWLHHRVLDTATNSFLSPDPLGGVPGTPVVANPYHYAANDPVRLCDPLGLRPMTDADLEVLRESAARPVWQKAYDSSVDLVGDPISWAADHWETIAAAGLIVVGSVLVATGVGAPIGAGIIVGASMSFAAQVAMTGEVDQKSLLVSTAAGAVGGAIGGASSAMTVSSQIAIAAGSDAAISAGSQYALTGTVDPEQVLFDGTIGGVTAGATTGLTWAPETKPFGFATHADYIDFGREFRDGFIQAGYHDADVFVRGSSVTGQRFDDVTKTYYPLVGEPGDFDLAVSGDEFLRDVKGLGMRLREGRSRSGPLYPRHERQLGLVELHEALARRAGRKVSFMAYRDEAAVAQRGQYKRFPD